MELQPEYLHLKSDSMMRIYAIMDERKLNKAKTLAQLPPTKLENLNHLIRSKRDEQFDAIIVLDDDPTGTQTVHNIPVLTDWSVETIQSELNRGTTFFFILTNSRSLSQNTANELALTIGNNIQAASRQTKKRCMVISRSDSTLRGHYPTEVEALELGLGADSSVNILIPAFFEGGRYTIDDVHYVAQNQELIPAAQTPYANDRVFGYQHSNLRHWVEEKTKGAILATEIISFSIDELRMYSLEFLVNKLNRCEPGSTCIVNAADYHDLQVFVLALMHAKILPICRTAASFVKALHAVPSKPLIQGNDLTYRYDTGGLVVIGSYVPKTTRQLQHLKANVNIHPIELQVRMILNANEEKQFLLQQYSDRINDLLKNGEDVVLYTSRDLIAANSTEENLSIASKISGFITEIVKRVEVHPKYLIAKGGITSCDIAIQALGVKRAIVQGQALPGIPVWKLGPESKFAELPYIIFPGNVGEDDAITKVINRIS